MTIRSFRNFFAPDLASSDPSTTSFQVDVTNYATEADLPASGSQAGVQAFVEATNSLYIWTGTAWYTVSTASSDLTITQGANVAYALATDGTPTYVNLVATSSNTVTWDYTVTNGSLGNTTVAHTGGDFAITPSTNAADAGTFLISFNASDGTGYAGDSSSFTLSLPQRFGWVQGGWTGTTINRIAYDDDTAVATVRGPLGAADGGLGTAGNNDYGWMALGVGGSRSMVHRISYADDLVAASIRSPMNIPRLFGAGTGNTERGFFGGGYLVPTNFSTVERIDYANDLTSPIIKGPLGAGRSAMAASGNTDYGWFGGGSAYPSYYANVYRIDYAADTSTASLRGPLSIARAGLGSTGNASYGWFGSGKTPAGFFTTVDRITYASDTGTATVRGPMTGRRNPGASGDKNYGWFSGGAPINTWSIVERIDYSNDGVAASVRGPLSATLPYAAAVGGYPG